MTTDQFNEIVRQRFQVCEKTLIRKAEEYAHGDRLSNFKDAAKFFGCSPEMALMGIWVKHLIALRDFVGTIEEGGNVPDEWWDEKIGDSINYLVLLQALVMERSSYGRAEPCTTEPCNSGWGLGR